MIKKILIITLLLLSFFSNLNSSSSEEIQSRIQKVLDALPASTNLGILIYNPLLEDTIYSVNHTQSMIPASTTKLFTTAAALELMGSNYMLSTQILSDDEDFSDSVLNGNIYLRGLGNSVFSSSDLDSLIGELVNFGIKKITGNIVGDDTFFDDVYTRDDWIKGERANVKLPAISALVLDRNTKHVKRKRRGRWRTYRIYVSNPPENAAATLKQKLTDAGISVDGRVNIGSTPRSAVMLMQSSVVLSDIIKSINKNSDNFLAECLFKAIGAVSSGQQGNSFYSTQAILTFIEDNAIYSEGTAVVDGSGISRYDQITAGAINGLLEKMYFDLKNFGDFYSSLSIAGVDGTLEDRMNKRTDKIKFRGKTGTLNGVSSLSGYLTTKSGDELIVSMIFEFTRGGSRKYRDAQDEIIRILNNWNEESPEETSLQGY